MSLGDLIGAVQRELTEFYYTVYESLCRLGMKRVAPLFAGLTLVAAGGALLLIVFGAGARAAGHVIDLHVNRRAAAGIAVMAGYFVWNGFASPDRIAFLESDYSDEPAAERRVRRQKTAAVIVTLAIGVAFTFGTARS